VWVCILFNHAKRYHSLLNGNLRELDFFSKGKKNNVLRALIVLSKYVGVYEQFKARIKSYGIKCERQNSLQSFLRIFNAKAGLIEWLKATFKVLDDSYATFMRFALISGLRRTEAINSFNLIIELSKKGELSKYYNSELESLEHFRFENMFIRRTKNVFFSFVPKDFIKKVAECKPISFNALRKRLERRGLNVRINELRDFWATFMVRHGLIREEADLLQGRIGISIFMRHYFSPAIKDLKERTLKAIAEMP
jgi:intergrase/recombinase